MGTILESIEQGWGWKLGKPLKVVATNRFGNVLVEIAGGRFFRIVPEDLACEEFAHSKAELDKKMEDEAFIRDWEMVRLVERAEASLGEAGNGRVYYLVIPSVLGGAYSVENIRTIPHHELLSCSGDIARQMVGVPDGAQVKLVVKNHA
jgi:hypothetical protein